jgi:hypothetical protein
MDREDGDKLRSGKARESNDTQYDFHHDLLLTNDSPK